MLWHQPRREADHYFLSSVKAERERERESVCVCVDLYLHSLTWCLIEQRENFTFLEERCGREPYKCWCECEQRILSRILTVISWRPSRQNVMGDFLVDWGQFKYMHASRGTSFQQQETSHDVARWVPATKLFVLSFVLANCQLQQSATDYVQGANFHEMNSCRRAFRPSVCMFSYFVPKFDPQNVCRRNLLRTKFLSKIAS